MTEQTAYLKCKRCNHDDMLGAELMNRILSIIPGGTIHPMRLYLDQNWHSCKCPRCSNEHVELVLGTKKNEDISPYPDPNQEVYCCSCGCDIEKERLKILPDTNVCAHCAQSVINLFPEEDSNLDHESCRLCNSVMVLVCRSGTQRPMSF